MSDMLDGAVGSLRMAAKAAEDAETSFRASLRDRLEALERERVFAYRRLNLVLDLMREAAGQDSADTATAAVIACVAAAFALQWGRERHETILDRLHPVAEAVVATTHPITDATVSGTGETGSVPDVATTLAEFEAWYHDETGAHFLARADIVMPEAPLTDW